MCSVLIKDQKDLSGGGSVGGGGSGGGSGSYGVGGRRGGGGSGGGYDAEEMAEEQGWVARMVHLFRSEDLEVQFQVSRAVFSLSDCEKVVEGREAERADTCSFWIRSNSSFKRRGSTSQTEEIAYGTPSLLLSPPVSSSLVGTELLRENR